MVSDTRRPGKSIIVAVGRSGTTILHRLLLEIYVDHFGSDFDCLYEPFVWDSAAVGHYPRDKAREAQFGLRDAISEEGIYLHTRTPLFTGPEEQGPEGLARYLKGNRSAPLLAKFIRANGRLSVLDKLYPDGKFVLMVRNPFDVVNSVLTKFSFFGAEFHKNDFPRFADDIARLHGVKLPDEGQIPPAYKAGLWCHFMNLHALQHAQGKPNYKVIVYEDFTRNREAYARQVCEHIGVAYKDIYGAVLGKSVGRVTEGAHALTKFDADVLMPMLESYASHIAHVPQITPFDPQAVLKKYAPETLRREPVEPRGLGWSPNKLESELIKRDRGLREIAAASAPRPAEVRPAAVPRPAQTATLRQFLEARAPVPFEDTIVLINGQTFAASVGPPVSADAPFPNNSRLLFYGNHTRSTDDLLNSVDFRRTLLRIRMERSPYAMILGKGDYLLDNEVEALLPSNLHRLWGNNLAVKGQKLRYFPMGRDFRSLAEIKSTAPTPQKSILCYVNYSTNTHPVRAEIFEAIKDKDFMLFEHMGNFLQYTTARSDFMAKLAASKFAVCPRGNAIETFRMWDSLSLGTIPIVVKEAAFHDELTDLPILFLDDAKDYGKLTAAFLEETYQAFLDKPFNLEKLRLSYWLNQVYGDCRDMMRVAGL